jgi:transglutaminase-like putative cysteine protease
MPRPPRAPSPLRRPLAALTLLLGLAFAVTIASTPLPAATRRALIVVGLATNETQSARLHETAASIQNSLHLRGFPPANVTVLSSAPAPAVSSGLRSPPSALSASALLAALAPAPAATPDDETWLVLLGTSAPDRSGQPAFQIPGPRLTATALATALAALPGRKTVVVATSASGGFLPLLLAIPDTEAVAATAETGQIQEPRFPAFWAEALAARPDAPFAALAATASERVTAYYEENSLAQSETARLLDRATGSILEPPFSASSPVGRPLADAPPAPAPSLDIAALQIPRATTSDEIERRPADATTLALLAEARAAAADLPHAALLLRTEAELLVAADFSSRETWRTRAYLRTGEALDDLGSLRLPFSPPFVTSALVSARVIRPDGAQLLLNPAARSARLAADSSTPAGPRPAAPPPSPPSGHIEFPELTADCIVEAEWTIDRRTDGTLPEFYEEWHFARPYPQKSLRVTLTLPADTSRWHHFAPHLPVGRPLADAPPPPAATSRTTIWDLSDLPAHEPLPHAPPARTILPWLGVSSVPTWDAFAAWYRRLAAGSDTTGPALESLAAEIAAAHPDRASRLRAAYERVAALRYVAIELGVGAFRPRTPEQVWLQRHGDCKDKANLLVALLARLDIPAQFALVNRFDATFPAFPGWQFNHALTRVPAAPAEGQPHDLWLDTTDRLVPFGIVAPGDLGRQALAFTPGFATAAFHEITAAQEPPATWTETFSEPSPGLHHIQISATGSAELALRRLLLDLSPAQRRATLADWLGSPVTTLHAPDAFDLSRPFTLSLTTSVAPAPHLRPLVPGLATYLLPSDHPRLWDEGRTWTHTRITPSGPQTQLIPAHLP